MLLASFILSPFLCSLQRSEPARSHTVSLTQDRDILTQQHSGLHPIYVKRKIERDILADVHGLTNRSLWADVQDTDGEDAVAVKRSQTFECLG